VHGKSWLERCDRRGEDPFDVFKQTFSPPGGDLSSKTLSSMPLSDGKIVGRAMHNYRLSKTAGYKEKWPLATAKASVVANLGHHGRKLLLRIAAQLNQGSVESLVTQEWPASDVIAICKELDPQESVYRCEEYFGSGGSNTPSNANRRLKLETPGSEAQSDQSEKDAGMIAMLSPELRDWYQKKHG
jgi:hypothetical protein